MRREKLQIILFAIALTLVIGISASFLCCNNGFLILCIRLTPIIMLIGLAVLIKKLIHLFKRKFLKPKKKDSSESIFQKRLKRFKSIKRGYYSLIILGVLYIISLLGPLWMNNKPIFILFTNEKYDEGEKFVDTDAKNGKYDYGENFIDRPNGKYDSGEIFNDANRNGKYDPNEIFEDIENGKWDEGEKFTDVNRNGKYDYGENFIDRPNGKYDSGEKFIDCNKAGSICDGDPTWKPELGNGVWDSGEIFEDIKNGKWDEGEKFTDANIFNGKWDEGEPFIDQRKYYFPAIRDFLSFIPGVSEARYSAQLFNQDGAVADFRKLQKTIEQDSDSDDFIVMPFYSYHPHEDLSDELDEEFIDLNQNEVWDRAEPFIDCNESFSICNGDHLWDPQLGNGVWDQGENFNDVNGNGVWDPAEPLIDDNKNKEHDTYNPPTKPGDSSRYILGTETSGKDVFTRLVDGYKISITFALIVTTLSYIIGVIIGAFLGYFGGKWDLFGVRLIEIFSSIPFLFVLMILAGFMKPNVYLLALLSVLLKGWIGITMYIRGEFFREKPKDYVSAAVSMGQSTPKIMFKHILPNSLTPIITFAPFSIIGDIFTLVSLDFLGYGLKPPASSWGALLKQGSENLSEWHLLVMPIIVLTITIFMITFISEAIREAFDPRVYSRLR